MSKNWLLTSIIFFLSLGLSRFCVSSSWCRGLVCDRWLWHFLVKLSLSYCIQYELWFRLNPNIIFSAEYLLLEFQLFPELLQNIVVSKIDENSCKQTLAS